MCFLLWDRPGIFCADYFLFSFFFFLNCLFFSLCLLLHFSFCKYGLLCCTGARMRRVIIQEVCSRFCWRITTQHWLFRWKTPVLYPNGQHSHGEAKRTKRKGAEGMRWSDPSANKPSCWHIHHDATSELQLTGGILHRVVSEFMYFTNLISPGWSCTALWGPQSPPVWNKFPLSCTSQPDKGCRAILVHTVVARISSAASGPGGHSLPGRAGKHAVGLGDNSNFQPFVRLLQAAHRAGDREGLCYCSYLCSPASPSPPSSISDTDFTAAISLVLSAEFLSHSLFCCFG